MNRAATDDELARVVREHAGQLATSLVRLIGDFTAAEDLVQDAVEAALEHWPHEGIPANPDGWLYTVARRRGLNVLRRDARYRDKLALMQWPIPSAPGRTRNEVGLCAEEVLGRRPVTEAWQLERRAGAVGRLKMLDSHGRPVGGFDGQGAGAFLGWLEEGGPRSRSRRRGSPGQAARMTSRGTCLPA